MRCWRRKRSAEQAVRDLRPHRYRRADEPAPAFAAERGGGYRAGAVSEAAPEFLSSLTLETLNQALKLQLSQEATLVLMQPKGEPEMSMKQLQETYDGIMMPAPAVVTEEAKPADTAVAAPATDAGAQ